MLSLLLFMSALHAADRREFADVEQGSDTPLIVELPYGGDLQAAMTAQDRPAVKLLIRLRDNCPQDEALTEYNDTLKSRAVGDEISYHANGGATPDNRPPLAAWLRLSEGSRSRSHLFGRILNCLEETRIGRCICARPCTLVAVVLATVFYSCLFSFLSYNGSTDTTPYMCSMRTLCHEPSEDNKTLVDTMFSYDDDWCASRIDDLPITSRPAGAPQHSTIQNYVRDSMHYTRVPGRIWHQCLVAATVYAGHLDDVVPAFDDYANVLLGEHRILSFPNALAMISVGQDWLQRACQCERPDLLLDNWHFGEGIEGHNETCFTSMSPSLVEPLRGHYEQCVERLFGSVQHAIFMLMTVPCMLGACFWYCILLHWGCFANC